MDTELDTAAITKNAPTPASVYTKSHAVALEAIVVFDRHVVSEA